MVAQIDYGQMLDGLALFVNRHVAFKYLVPFGLEERVVVGNGFATRDLLFAFNRSQRYWVLVLGDRPTRLFEGCEDIFEEVTTGGFPMTYHGIGPEFSASAEQRVNRDDHQRQFFRQVDVAFGQLATADPLPVGLVGRSGDLALFGEISANRNLVLATLIGDSNKTSDELRKEVWPLMTSGFAKRRQEASRKLEAAIQGQCCVSGIEEVSRLAKEGRGDTLIAEKGFFCTTQRDGGSPQSERAESLPLTSGIHNAVDEVVEVVVSKGGQVVFVDNGTLSAHGRVAVILRY